MRLQLQIERLEVEARGKAEQLAEAKENVASLEAYFETSKWLKSAENL